MRFISNPGVIRVLSYDQETDFDVFGSYLCPHRELINKMHYKIVEIVELYKNVIDIIFRKCTSHEKIDFYIPRHT